MYALLLSISSIISSFSLQLSISLSVSLKFLKHYLPKLFWFFFSWYRHLYILLWRTLHPVKYYLWLTVCQDTLCKEVQVWFYRELNWTSRLLHINYRCINGSQKESSNQGLALATEWETGIGWLAANYWEFLKGFKMISKPLLYMTKEHFCMDSRRSRGF